ncbi:hypothetical protein N4849_14100, partial [Enterococcus faecalis]|uniref:hypothetical protein n=1 Tax=Enterococcus faecalis TaxID=1351 RepID=UPI0021E0244C
VRRQRQMRIRARDNSHFLIGALIPKVNNGKSLNPLTRQLLADKLATLHQRALADCQTFTTSALLFVPVSYTHL